MRIFWLPGLLLASVTQATLAQFAWDKADWPKTDFSRRTVEFYEIQSGGPRKDGIPAIDRPVFDSVQAVRRWLKPQEPVISLRVGDEARAYPLQILMFHEIVNDRIGAVPVAVTFCPLCNASMVFERRVGNVVLDFGTTGMLRKSDLVMYDRQTESWWQQFSGAGIVGRHANAALRRLPSQIVSFEEFSTSYPNGKVLSRSTGFHRPYGSNPYLGYDRIDQSPFLFTDPVDKRLPPMERAISVTIDARQRVYPFAALEKQPIINDELGGEPIAILSRGGMASPLDDARIERGRKIPAASAFSRRLDGQVLQFAQRNGKIVDTVTDSEWSLLGEALSGRLKGKRLVPLDSGVHFAFAWLAFNPDSEIWRPAELKNRPSP